MLPSASCWQPPSVCRSEVWLLCEVRPRTTNRLGSPVLKQQFERKLDSSGRVRLTGNHTELRGPKCQPGVSEANAVEHVEELATQLQVYPSVAEEPVVLDESRI